MNSLRGHLLVASPHLVDPNFHKTVVLMVQHDGEGAFGLVLNRPTGKTIQDVWKLMSDDPCECDSPILLGGPVRGPLAALHTQEDHSNIEIVPGLYYTVDDKSLGDVLRADIELFRIFIGYSGWGAGQLENELEAGSWFTTDVAVKDVFHEPHDMWQKVSRRIGREFLDATIKPRFVPENPSLN